MPMPTVEQAEFRYSTHTSKSGQYTLDDLAAGEYRLLVEGYVSHPVRVDGDTEFDIELPLGDLAGRVLNESNGAPVPELTGHESGSGHALDLKLTRDGAH
jgi:hypothetical protein